MIFFGLLMVGFGAVGILLVTAQTPPPPIAPFAMLLAIPLLVAGEIFVLAGIIRWAVAPLWERLDQLHEFLDRKK